MSILIAAHLMPLAGSAPPNDPAFAPFGSVTLTPAATLNGAGSNVDTIAFWETADPEQRLMFVTGKSSRNVEVWRFSPTDPDSFVELTPLDDGNSDNCLAGGQVNGVVVDHRPHPDRLYISVGESGNRICIFALDAAAPQPIDFRERVDAETNLGSEPNLGLLHHANGKTFLYLSADTILETYEVRHDPDDLVYVGRSDSGDDIPPLETVIGDDFRQTLYIPNENGAAGVSIFTVQTNGMPGPVLRDSGGDPITFGSNSIFDSDEEGILLYVCPAGGGGDDGRGLVVVSDQRSSLTDFEVFDRQTTAHLGVLHLSGVNNTDGIASTQQSFPGFPDGIFAAIDDDTLTAVIGWHEILAATGLSCGDPPDPPAMPSNLRVY